MAPQTDNTQESDRALKGLGGARLFDILQKHPDASRVVSMIVDVDGTRLAGPSACCGICVLEHGPTGERPCIAEHLRQSADREGIVKFSCGGGINAAMAAIRFGTSPVEGYVVGAHSAATPLSAQGIHAGSFQSTARHEAAPMASAEPTAPAGDVALQEGAPRLGSRTPAADQILADAALLGNLDPEFQELAVTARGTAREVLPADAAD